MAFKVQIVGAAEQDIAEATAFIYDDSPAIADKWLSGLLSAILALSEMPLRFALIPESKELKRPLRGFPYHSHRVVYEVDETTQSVLILRVYHSARAPLRLEDIE